ncbi:hypothetical protein V9L05_14555 [Bernardetia sp. Wsw4-3y2]|uniref:hypothetical protein n=1 Tax=Bernardetia sp. Wsw4-3y2 TaxID=3127471 RepID=UPI0030CFA5DC
MKLIRKLNPFNPILPAFCLLIAFACIGYDSFFREKYTEEEKAVSGSAIGGIKNLGHQYLNDAEKMSRDLDDYFTYEYCMKDNYKEFHFVSSELRTLTSRLIKENFINTEISRNKEISIQSIFNSYIKEAIQLDTLLKKKYQNFELENGLSDKEINKIYFSHDSIQSAYHLARFELQLSKMCYDDIELLINHSIKDIIKEKIKNASITPYVIDKTSEIYINEVYPFDMLHTKILFPKETETQFNKNGHLIIPKALRNTKVKIEIGINCSSDTIYFYQTNYEN